MRKLVTVITPTWQRHDLLVECMANVAKQLYDNIEHVVVSDGPDGVLNSYMRGWPNALRAVPVTYVELGRNWTSIIPNSFGVAPLLVGSLVAKGDYQMWWCDDERAYTQHHIDMLVDLLEEGDYDFVYPRVCIWRNGDPNGPEGTVIGSEPPRHGQITHFLYKAELMREVQLKFGEDPCDWAIVDAWLKKNFKYKLLPHTTFEHRLDR